MDVPGRADEALGIRTRHRRRLEQLIDEVTLGRPSIDKHTQYRCASTRQPPARRPTALYWRSRLATSRSGLIRLSPRCRATAPRPFLLLHSNTRFPQILRRVTFWHMTLET